MIPARLAIGAVAAVLYWATINTSAGFYLTMNPFVVLVFLWLRNEINAARESWLDRVGRWSSSIYLFHVIGAAYVGKLTGQPLIVTPAALLLCYLAYRAFERPAHQLARTVFTLSRRSAPSSG